MTSSTAPRLEGLLTQFEPISLSEMEDVALLNRVDTKYVMRVSQLYQALQRVAEQYRVLEINHTRLSHYRTLYFDTPDFALYQQHHNGLRSRYKVRMREYVDTDQAYWEVKCKTNRERTRKSRLRTSDTTDTMREEVGAFIDEHTPFDVRDLEPKLWSNFLRITLVSTQRPERLTLDVDLEFGRGDMTASLPGIAIAEIKQARSTEASDFARQMRWLGIRPDGFSKYCAGVYTLYDGVKINNFKARMRQVHRLMQEEERYERFH